MASAKPLPRRTRAGSGAGPAYRALRRVWANLAPDAYLGDIELHRLAAWLAEYDTLCSDWPGAVVCQRVARVVGERLLLREDAEDMMITLDLLQTPRLRSGAGPDLCLYAGPIELAGRRFCFTGKFLFGSRTRCEAAVSACGGRPIRSVRRGLDFLVVGTLAAHVRPVPGAKIDRALAYRREGGGVRLIAEATWLEAMAQQDPAGLAYVAAARGAATAAWRADGTREPPARVQSQRLRRNQASMPSAAPSISNSTAG